MDFDFREPDRFTTGTVGEPGQRIFYIQVVEGDHLATFRLEKQQVDALADSMADLLIDVADVATQPDEMTLALPIVTEWVVGAMGVAYDESTDRVLIAVQEAPADDDADDPTDGLADEEPEGARILLTRPQAAAFVKHAREVISAGRPPCPFCGGSEDPDRHICPRMN
jgi:uncharacterized repeat protein (TIGR03847 family)